MLTPLIILGTLTCFFFLAHGPENNMDFVAMLWREALGAKFILPSLASFDLTLVLQIPSVADLMRTFESVEVIEKFDLRTRRLTVLLTLPICRSPCRSWKGQKSGQRSTSSLRSSSPSPHVAASSETSSVGFFNKPPAKSRAQ